MLPTIYEVKNIEFGTLSVMAKPVSGEWVEEEFLGLKRLGVNKVISLLERQEQIEVGLGAEKELCEQNGIEYENFPIPDRGLPKTSLANDFVSRLAKEISQGKHIVIHCRAGIGRTGIIAGGVLVKAGIAPEQALALISKARGVQVPDTEEQESWLCTKINM